MFIRQLSLQTKVSLLIIVPGLLILSISTVLSYSQQRQSALKNMSLLASQTGEVIEQALQQDMLESILPRKCHLQDQDFDQSIGQSQDVMEHSRIG